MKTSEGIAKISDALAKAQGLFNGVAKSGKNEYDRYKYANLEDYRDAIVEGLRACSLSIITSVDQVIPCEPRTTKNGGAEQVVRVHLTQRISHSSGEWIETECYGEGQDRSDKAIYKAITGARKYALCSALNLATSDDPENDGNKPSAPAPAPKPVVSAPKASKPAPAPKVDPEKSEAVTNVVAEFGGKVVQDPKKISEEIGLIREGLKALGVKTLPQMQDAAMTVIGRKPEGLTDLSGDERKKMIAEIMRQQKMVAEEAAK
jgi:uncharacterized protein YunC (DUF1805 family)